MMWYVFIEDDVPNVIMSFLFFVAPILFLNKLRAQLKKSRYYTHRILSLWKIIVFMACILISLEIQEDNAFSFFSLASHAFNESRHYLVQEVSDFFHDDICNKYNV